MSERAQPLSEREAYSEAMSFHFNYNSREFTSAEYDRFSRDFDASRNALNTLTDEQIKDLHTHAAALAADGNDEAAENLDSIIWNMPFIDEDRAFNFYEIVLASPDADKDLLSTVAAGMRQMTFVDPERSIALWKLGFQNEEIDRDRLTNPFWSAAQSIFSGSTLIDPEKVELAWESFTDEEKNATLINRVSILKSMKRLSEE